MSQLTSFFYAERVTRLGEVEWLQAVRRSLVTELSRSRDGWRDDGEQLLGPGTLAVRVAVMHGRETGHVDIGYLESRSR